MFHKLSSPTTRHLGIWLLAAASLGALAGWGADRLLAENQASPAQAVGSAVDSVASRTADDAIGDQTLLAKTAMGGPSSRERLSAAEKLTDQALLAKVAVEAKDALVRCAAVERLSDQLVLSKVAVGDEDWFVRRAASLAVRDQTILARIAAEDVDWHVRQAAATKLTDQTLLARLAMEDRDLHVRSTAAGVLSDPILLAKIAAGTKDPSIRRDIGKRFGPPASLAAARTSTESGLPVSIASYGAPGSRPPPTPSFRKDEPRPWHRRHRSRLELAANGDFVHGRESYSKLPTRAETEEARRETAGEDQARDVHPTGAKAQGAPAFSRSGTAPAIEKHDNLNLRTGWAVGEGGLILSTVDGGQTWTPQESGTTEDLRSVWFTDQAHGFAVGEQAVILRTTNGGKTWQMEQYPVKARHSTVKFLDSRHGCILTHLSHILETTDGGQTWGPIALPGKGPTHAMSFWDASTGLVTSDGPRMIRTADGGKSWQETPIPLPRPKPRGLASLLDSAPADLALVGVSHGSLSHAWAVGHDMKKAERPYGTIVATRDGGMSWTSQWSHQVTYLYATSFSNDRFGLAAGYAGSAARPLVLLTTDSGKVWKARFPPGNEILTGALLVDHLHGWVVGTKGYIAATDDFGATWRRQTTGVQRTVFGIHFPQEQAKAKGKLLLARIQAERGDGSKLNLNLKEGSTAKGRVFGMPGLSHAEGSFSQKAPEGETTLIVTGADAVVHVKDERLGRISLNIGGEFLVDQTLRMTGEGNWDGKKDGATHTLLGKLTMFEYEFSSDQASPLRFKVTTDGYAYLDGKGTVKDLQTGKQYSLP